MVALLVWAVLLLVAGGVAAATHDDGKQVATRPSGPTTTTLQGSSLPGSTSTGSPASTDSTASTGSSDGATDSSGDNPIVDSGPGATAPAAKVMPTPGRYSLYVSGTSSLNGAPQSVPQNGSYTITKTSDTDTETSGDFKVVLRWAPDSASLVRLTIAQANKTFEPAQPVLFVPFPGTAGRAWEWTLTSTDGKTTVHQTSQITGAENIDVGGVAVPTFVVDSTLTFTGDLKGTARVTTWVSDAERLSIKTHTVTDVTLGLFRAQSDITTVLASLTPA
jgi:hypothetical protein